MDREMTIIEPKKDRLTAVNGAEVEYGEGFYRVEIQAGQPVSIEYANGKTLHVTLMPGVKSMPLEFLANNPDILRAMANYRTFIKELSKDYPVITDRMRRKAAEYSAFMVQGHQRIMGARGHTIQVRINDDESDYLNSDPIPGATLNTSYLRTERVNVDENGIITSVVLQVSPEFNSMNSLSYDFNLLTTIPEIAAAV